MTKMLKAIAGFFIAGGGALATAAESGNVTQNEWYFIVSSAVVALAGVWAVPNTASA